MISRTIARTGMLALAMTFSTATVMTFGATAAYAEKGGNGNGNGNGRANRNDREQRGNGNGRGAIASELRGLNAAHANQNALENASPNSMPGKLYVYQQNSIELAELEAVEAEALAEYDAAVQAAADAETAEQEAQANFDAVASADPATYESVEAYNEALTQAAADLQAAIEASDAADAEVVAKDETVQTAAADRSAAETLVTESLEVLTRGRELSEAALTELGSLLGLN